MSAVLALLATLLCVLLGSFVAAAEASVSSMNEPRLRALTDELGPARSRHLTRYLEDPHGLLSRLLTFRIAMLVLASQLVRHALVPERSVAALLASTVGLVVLWAMVVEGFSALGRSRSAAWAPWALSFTRPVEWIVTPLATPAAWLSRAISRRTRHGRVDETDKSVTEREVEYVVEAAESTGALDPRRGEMLQNVLEFKDVTVRDVMVPRTRMNALPATTPLLKALASVGEEGHSRVPVYDGSIDNVVGILHVKDLFRTVGSAVQASAAHELKGTLLPVLRRPVLQVPPTQSAMQLLRDMQSRRTHMAVVIDEFGAVSGLVTLEDLLEELVGEIADEHDDLEEEAFAEIEPGRFVAAAAIPIGELGDRLGVEFPEDEGYASLGGFLAERSGRVPVPGTVVSWGGFTFTVREGDARRATRVEILAAGSAPPDAPNAPEAP
jgi:putative hemolysin